LPCTIRAPPGEPTGRFRKCDHLRVVARRGLLPAGLRVSGRQADGWDVHDNNAFRPSALIYSRRVEYNDLGLVQKQTGDYPAATASHQQALTLSGDLGNLLGQAEALNRLGELSLRTSAPGQARDQHTRALAIARDISAAPEEATDRGELESGALPRDRMAALSGPMASLAVGNRWAVPASPADPSDAAGKVPLPPWPVYTLCQCCAAQGPTPETRSTLM